MFNGLKEAMLEQILSSLNGFDEMVNKAQNVLTGSGTGSFDSDTVWNAVLGIADALKPFCYIVIALCLMIEIAQVLTKVDVVKWEHGLKLGIKMVFAKVCIDVAPTFLRACFNQANIWINSALHAGSYQNLGSMLTGPIQTYTDEISGGGRILGLFASTMLVSLAVKICGLLIQIIAYGRMFELYVYLAVSPFPCAFFPLGDGTGGGFSRITQKFFKSFIAVCLQGVMIIICIRIFYMIIGSAFTEMIAAAQLAGTASGKVSELCFTMLLGAVVLVMSVSRCGSWAKGIIDAM